MMNLVIYFIALIITFPVIVTLILYWMAVKFFKHQLKAIHFTVNWTTLLYIIADLILIFYMFEWQLTGILFIILLVLLAVIMIIQWKINTDVQFFMAFKILWRFCFLFFLLLYICLVLFGIISRIFLY